jgi:hypothetical protein
MPQPREWRQLSCDYKADSIASLGTSAPRHLGPKRPEGVCGTPRERSRFCSCARKRCPRGADRSGGGLAEPPRGHKLRVGGLPRPQWIARGHPGERTGSGAGEPAERCRHAGVHKHPALRCPQPSAVVTQRAGADRRGHEHLSARGSRVGRHVPVVLARAPALKPACQHAGLRLERFCDVRRRWEQIEGRSLGAQPERVSSASDLSGSRLRCGVVSARRCGIGSRRLPGDWSESQRAIAQGRSRDRSLLGAERNATRIRSRRLDLDRPDEGRSCTPPGPWLVPRLVSRRATARLHRSR